MRVGLKQTRSNIAPRLSRIEKKLRRVPDRAHKYFVSVTPIDTGNARSRTRLRNNTIYASYPYAKRLNEGWSRQAPRGMVEPTMRYIRQLVRGIFGR